jgi:hypothetical protein
MTHQAHIDLLGMIYGSLKSCSFGNCKTKGRPSTNSQLTKGRPSTKLN